MLKLKSIVEDIKSKAKNVQSFDQKYSFHHNINRHQIYAVIWSEMLILSESKLNIESKKFFYKRFKLSSLEKDMK